MSNDDFLYAPEEIANQEEGFTESKFELTPAAKAAYDEMMKPIERGLDKMTSRGGKGQEGVGRVDGSILTIKETAAVTIAKDIVDDALRHHSDKELKDLSLMELARFAKGRTNGRACSDAQVLAELTRMQNHEIYGDRVARPR